MDDDLDFALEGIKGLLEGIKETGEEIEDHLGDVTRTLGRIADDIVLLKIDVDSITGSVKKPNDAAAGSSLGWFIFGIFVLLLVHVIHHW